jgi:hypothetical protein
MGPRELSALEKFIAKMGETTSEFGKSQFKGQFLADQAKRAAKSGMQAVKDAPGATSIGAGGGALAALIASGLMGSSDDDEEMLLRERGY